MTIANALRTKIRRGIDLAVFVSAILLTLVSAVDLADGKSDEPVLAIAILVITGGCALLGLMGRARWTPIAYIALIVVMNASYLASYGPWFGLGSVYVVLVALSFLFIPKWTWLVVASLVATPVAIGVGVWLHALPPVAIAIGDVQQWTRGAFGSLCGQIGVALVVSYAVGQLVRERRELERAAEVQREQGLEQKSVDDHLSAARRADSIAQLAAEVGSDIGKALAIVRARAQALATELRSTDAVECIDDILEASGTAAATMHTLTAFGPIVEVAPQANAADAVRALPKLVRRALPERIQLDISVEAELVVGIAATDLQRICTNLVLNARDAIAGPGIISVVLQCDRECALLIVSDTGAGMSEETLGKLFRPFFTTKPVGRGTGLGLATTKILVERAGGQISVTSEAGIGTAFAIRLPLRAVQGGREVIQHQVDQHAGH